MAAGLACLFSTVLGLPSLTRWLTHTYSLSRARACAQTPGAVNTIRVINENTVEFPFDAWVLPYKTVEKAPTVQIGGGF